jgi:ABC-type sugar transport system ATPase subunit
MGENGAGKSTLGKILAGIDVADGGAIHLRGKQIAPQNPAEARALGIAMVHQELAFCPELTIAENLCLGSWPHRRGWVDRDALRDKARRLLADVGFDEDVDRLVGELTTGQEQLLQIAAALGTGARILVFDEPTSSLSAVESERLFELLADLKRRGFTVVYVSHRMEEIFRLCDTITVLRDGQHVATESAADSHQDRLVQQMVGRSVEHHEPDHLAKPLGDVALQVEGLSSGQRLQEVSLTLRRGEILGLAGLVGAGRSELAQALFGLDPERTGTVSVAGHPLPPGDVVAAMEAGLGLLPEDRKRQGLVLGLNCRENGALAVLQRWSRWGWMDRRRERDQMEGLVRQLRVKAPSIESGIAGLSGGNQQKIALVKWLARECRVLVVDEPTRGVDVGAKAEIHRLLDQLACEGMAILLISSELPEVMNLSRRLLVMRGGRIVGEFQRSEFQQAAILNRMVGH